MSDKLVQVEHLKQYFPAGGFGKNKKFVKAVAAPPPPSNVMVFPVKSNPASFAACI